MPFSVSLRPGVSDRSIAIRLNRSATGIAYIRRKLGIPPGMPRRTRTNLSPREPSPPSSCWACGVIAPRVGSTVERTVTHGFVPVLETRSSIARLGISTHLTAGFGDDGYGGTGDGCTWTLEITCVHPVLIYPHTRIAQLAFFTLQGERQPYVGKYQSSDGPVASRSWRDYSEEGKQ